MYPEEFRQMGHRLFDWIAEPGRHSTLFQIHNEENR